MERPLSRLVLLFFGLLFTIFADFVESQSSDTSPHPTSPLRSSPPHQSPQPLPSQRPPPQTPASSSPRSPPPRHSTPPAKHRKNTTSTPRRRPPPQSHDHKLNRGEKIGLLFIGIVIILQICVVGFLVFKRRQLLKVKSSYETYSSSS
ncbi:hypothetical protein DITRI_Ditri02bG0075600 [Diplodiscus trichospermus]